MTRRRLLLVLVTTGLGVAASTWAIATRPPLPSGRPAAVVDGPVARPDRRRADPEAARACAEHFVKTLSDWAGEDWIVLEWPPTRQDDGDLEFQLYSASARAKHPTGRIEPGDYVWIEPTEPRLSLFSASSMVRPSAAKIDSAQAREVAERFCETFIEAADDPQYTIAIDVSQRPRRDGITQHWIYDATIGVRRYGIALPFGAALKIDAGKGAIIEVWLHGRAQPLPEVSMTPAEAGELAIQEVRGTKPGEPTVDTCELDWTIDRGRPWPFYRTTVLVPTDSGGQHGYWVHVDAGRRKVEIMHEFYLPPPGKLQNPCGGGQSDTSPVWGRVNGRDVVLFLSESRHESDDRPFRDETTVMMADVETGEMTCVLPVEEWRFGTLLGGGDRVVAIEVGDGGVDGFLLDLEQRQYRRLPGAVRAFYPGGFSIRPRTKQLVGRAWRTSGGEVDRAAVSLDPRGPKGIQWLPSEPGLDSWAVYDEAGGYEYRPFVVGQEGNNTVHRLKRRPLDSAATVPWQPCSPQLRDHELSMSRLDTERWLLAGWSPEERLLLNVRTATTEPWPWSLPDRPNEWNSAKLYPARAAASPDGRRIAVQWTSGWFDLRSRPCSFIALMTADGQFIRRFGPADDTLIPVKPFAKVGG